MKSNLIFIKFLLRSDNEKIDFLINKLLECKR